MKKLLPIAFYLLLTILLTKPTVAQLPSILDRQVPIGSTQQPLGQLLESLATKGQFYFSYTSAVLNKDSLVSLPLQTRTVRQTLDLLFKGRLQYREDGRYLILLPAPPKTNPPIDQKRIAITGTILDETTGEKIGQASVYDPDQLIATLSREDGSFFIRVKTRDRPITLTVSKEFYADTTIILQTGSGRQLTISIAPANITPRTLTLSPRNGLSRDSVSIEWRTDSAIIRAIVSKDLIQVESTGLGRFLLSSRLRIQTLNLKKFLVIRPVQLSLVPGISTNGLLNSQVINKFSVNIIGGYSAGLTGAELAGVFNIDKKKMIGFQAAGVVNIAGDTVSGVQLAGVANKDLDSLHGFQAAGVANSAKNVSGMQAAGVFNTAKQVNGIQAAGVFNTARTVDGVQLAGVFNHTKHLKGLQLGIVNLADTSDGVSIGLVNIVRHGMHELSVYADEWSPVNLAFRSGTPKFYGILFAGLNPDNDRRSYYYGYGFGRQCKLTQTLSLRPEVSFLHISPVTLQHFDKNTFVGRLNVDLHWQPTKQFGISAGPSCSIYNPDKDYYINGHLYQPLPSGYSTFSVSGRSIGWIGWRAAVNFF